MNAEQLHSIIKAVKDEIEQTDLINQLSGLVNALKQVINQSQAPQQEALSKMLNHVFELLKNAPSDDFSPAWKQILEELCLAELLGKNLKNKLENIFHRTLITPATAQKEVIEILTSLQQFNEAIDNIINSFDIFHIGAEELEPGECEIGLLVPRKAVDNSLDKLGKELNELNFIFNTFSELVTGKKETHEIKTLSSSDLLIYLNVLPGVAACLAYAVDKIINSYKNLIEIRKLQNELKDLGVPNEKTKGIKEHTNSLMGGEIEKITVEIDEKFCTVNDDGRRNELKNAIRISLNKVANRIDKGYNIEVRAEPLEEPEEGKEASDADEIHISNIAIILDVSKNMQFMKLTGEPILQLPESEKKGKPEKPK